MGRAPNVDLEAAIAGLDAADLVDAVVVTVDLAGRVVGTTAHHAALGDTDHELATGLHGLAGVVVGVLLAANGQVVADIGDNLIALQLGTFDGRVVTADDGQLVAGVDGGFS